jgi:6-phosphogluconolactonase
MGFIARRRTMLLRVTGISAVALALITCTAMAEKPSRSTAASKVVVYFGTYSQRGSAGIYVSEFDPKTGHLGVPVPAGELENPSFLAFHPSKPYVYAVSEIGDKAKGTFGSVASYSIDPDSRKLRKMNSQSSKGVWPCYVSVDKSGKYVLIANYGTSSLATYPIQEDGSVGDVAGFVEHTGKGPNADRQEAAHSHSINMDASNQYAIAADLGVDKLFVYRLNGKNGQLIANTAPSVSVEPGGGPRHFAFHPNGKFAVANFELSSEVQSFKWNSQFGILTPVTRLSTLDGKVPGNTTAEVRIHPNGKFVYCSNRGHDSIAIFKINPETGELTAAGRVSTQGKTPRNFGIDPSGKWLLAANQDTDNIVVFSIDPVTGNLTPAGESISVPAPVCVKFYAR